MRKKIQVEYIDTFLWVSIERNSLKYLDMFGFLNLKYLHMNLKKFWFRNLWWLFQETL